MEKIHEIIKKLSPIYQKENIFYGYTDYKGIYNDESELRKSNESVENHYSIIRFIIWNVLFLIIGFIIGLILG